MQIYKIIKLTFLKNFIEHHYDLKYFIHFNYHCLSSKETIFIKVAHCTLIIDCQKSFLKENYLLKKAYYQFKLNAY